MKTWGPKLGSPATTLKAWCGGTYMLVIPHRKAETGETQWLVLSSRFSERVCLKRINSDNNSN